MIVILSQCDNDDVDNEDVEDDDDDDVPISHLQVDIWPSTHLLQQPALELLSTWRHHRHHHKHYGQYYQDHHGHPHHHDEEPANGASPNKGGAPASDSG